MHLHIVGLEEILELPLGGRICEIPNVQPTSLVGAGCGGLVRSSTVGGVGDGGGGHGFGDFVNGGSRHVEGLSVRTRRELMGTGVGSWTQKAELPLGSLKRGMEG